jgi:plasmid maintenance system antidote protein VapI
MAMHNPPHPGEFIAETYMEPFGLSCRFLASKLNVAASTLNRVRRSPESWLAMQDNYDLWQARRQVKLGKVKKISLTAA